ncbi:5-oxoprolinase, partial [Agrobacterium tumefaciens]
LSGPAAGVVGGQVVGASAGIPNLITIDVGGTSADIALIADGKPMLRAEGLIGQHALRVPMVDVNTIGSGGGSIAWIDTGNGLKVGPESAGSEPGPACYQRGGQRPTVTDASAVLGYLSPEGFAGGTMTLSADLAGDVIEKSIATPLGLTLAEAALGIHRVVNAQMAEGIRLVSIRQGIDPRDFALVPLGGGGGMHATPLARDLGINTILVPRIPGVLAAAGLLASPVEHEVTGSFTTPLADLSVDALRMTLSRIDAEASALMSAENVDAAAIKVHHFADLCYIGQSYSIEVPFDIEETDLAVKLYERFMEAHDRMYGHAAKVAAKLTALRTVHRVGGAEHIAEMRLEPEAGDVVMGETDIVVEGAREPVRANLLNRERMAAGYTFSGPAILHQRDTTTLVEPGWTGRVDDAGNVILTRVA